MLINLKSLEMSKVCIVVFVSFLLTFRKGLVIACEGFEKCCVGFVWNDELQNCTKCNIGYTGKLCDQKCPYPTYGEICQQICNCNESLCSISSGCISGSTLLQTSTLYTTSNESSVAKSPNVNHHTRPQTEDGNTSATQILSHPLVLSLFAFNAIFIFVIVLFLGLFSRRLYYSSQFSGDRGIITLKMKQMEHKDENRKDSIGHLLSSTQSNNVNSNVLDSCPNNPRDYRNPSENAEYTEAKSIYTEMTAVSLSRSDCFDLCESVQLPRQPCQSVDEHIYLATDTLRFESETDTKEFVIK